MQTPLIILKRLLIPLNPSEAHDYPVRTSLNPWSSLKPPEFPEISSEAPTEML